MTFSDLVERLKKESFEDIVNKYYQNDVCNRNL